MPGYPKTKSCLWLIVLLILALPALTQAAEFSAEIAMQGNNTPATHGKVYIKGNKFRQEFDMGGVKHISIMRGDKQVVWMVIPDQKVYMEMALTPQAKAKMMKMPQDQAKMKLLGTETVNGYEADKYEATGTKGQASKEYVWVAKKLGMPLKMTSADGSFSMEYKNIKEGNVPDSVFEVPAGYQKMSMPMGMGMGGMRQGQGK
jgi:outer membrane lipoprotein-sorting protein